jgi:hypothetical protein
VVGHLFCNYDAPHQKEVSLGLGWEEGSSVVEYWSGISEALGSIPSTEEKKKSLCDSINTKANLLVIL